jgi:hypothetical protein
VTPTTDTNGLGRWHTETDAKDKAAQASDGAGHFGRALQARAHGLGLAGFWPEGIAQQRKIMRTNDNCLSRSGGTPQVH